MKYVARIHRNCQRSGFGISFLDFPGCISFGKSRDEAICNGKKALEFHIEGMIGDGEDVPPPRDHSEVVTDPELASWIEGADVVEVDFAPSSGPVEPPEDPFLRDIGKIFDLKFARLLDPFLIPDFPARKCEWEDVRAILLVESPHTGEVQVGYPLAGDSGEAVTRLISDNIQGLENLSGSIGKILNGKPNPLPWLGIVNVCRLPLQEAAYRKRPNDAQILMRHPSWVVFMESLKEVRDNPFTIHREDGAHRLVDRAIAEDLKRRSCNIRRFNSKSLACCGGVALAFYAKSRTVCLHHPSINQWKNSEARKAAEKFFRDNVTCGNSERAEPDSKS